MTVCGTGGFSGPLPGDPDNNVILTAQAVSGGIAVRWTYPGTNPHAVAHTLVYRATSNNFAAAQLHVIVAGNYLFDQMITTTATQYWYWIRIVSINGTTGSLIGPATAIAATSVSDMLSLLSGQISSGFLNAALNTSIGQISLNALNITQEMLDRDAADDSLGVSLTVIQAHSNTTRALLSQEVVARTTEYSSFVSSVNTWMATFDPEGTGGAGYSAAIQVETTARIDADAGVVTAVAQLIQTGQISLGPHAGASVQTFMGVDVVEVDGKVTDMGARWTAVVETTLDGRKLIGGFGIYNDGLTVQAGFNVDTFWIGRSPGGNVKNYPFIVSGGNVYMDNAFIVGLTADKIDTRNLTIKDSAGNVIFGSGQNLDWTRISGTGKPEDNATAGGYFATSNFQLGLGGWTSTSNGTALTAAAAAGALITNDPTFGNCGEFTRTTAGAFVWTRAAIPLGKGRVYRVTVIFKPTVVGTMTVAAATGALISTYANATGSPLVGTTTLAITSAGATLSVSMLVSSTAITNVQQLTDANTLYFRAGLYLVSRTGADPIVRIQSVLVEDATDAFDARVAATAATTLATTAQTSATTANALLADIASDAQLTPGEKQQVTLEWNIIVAEKAGIDAQADAYGIVAEKTTYGTGYSALNTYLNVTDQDGVTAGTQTLLGSLVTTTPLVGATFRTTFSTYYAGRQTLLNKIAEVAGTRANWASVTGSGKPQDYATAGGYLVSSNFTAGMADWTSTSAGTPLTAAAAGGVAVTGDATFNICGQFTRTTPGAFVWTRAVVPLVPGRVYRVTAIFKPTATTGMTVATAIAPLDVGYVDIPGSPKIGVNALAIVATGATLSATMLVSTAALTGVQQLSNTATRYVRAGLYLQSQTAGTQTVLIQSVLTEDVTDAYNAGEVAGTALTAANDAQTDATIANTLLADIASDNQITAGEKQRVKLEWTEILNEQSGISQQATAYDISTLKVAYESAYTALNVYLNTTDQDATVAGAQTILGDLTTTTPITGTVFRTNFATVYAARQALLNEIARVAGTRATWITITGTGKPQDYATVGSYLAVSDFLSGLDSWTAAAAGTATAGAVPGGSLITDDAAFGTCGEFTRATIGAYVYTRATVSLVKGRIYRVSVVFKATVVGPSMAVAAQIAPLTSGYAISVNGPMIGTEHLSVPTANVVQTTTMLVSTLSVTGVQTIPDTAALFFRAGLRLFSLASGSSTVRIQSVLIDDITDAYTAVQAAENAADAALLAQATADAATAVLVDIASDAVVMPGEKSAIQLAWTTIDNEKAAILSQATSYLITTEATAYTAAHTALNTYLFTTDQDPSVVGTQAILPSLTTTTPIDGPTFRTQFATLYAARQTLLNKIAAIAGTRADWATINGPGKPQDYATAGSYLAVSDFLLGLSSWTATATGTAITGAAPAGTLITNDTTFGVCGEFARTAAGAYVFARAPTSLVKGRVYRVNVIFKATSLGTSPMVVCAQVTTLDLAYASVQQINGTERLTVAAIETQQTSTMLVSTLSLTGVQTISDATALFFRAGFRLYSSAGGTPTVRIQSILIEDVTDAFIAAKAAQDAATQATAAQVTADAATVVLIEIASDSFVSPGEKPAIQLEWTNILNEYAGILAQATTYAISVEATTYTNTKDALYAYLHTTDQDTGTGVQYILPTLTTTTPIIGSVFRSTFAAFYTARQVLLNKIAEIAGTRATWASVTGGGKPQDYATTGSYLTASNFRNGIADWVSTSVGSPETAPAVSGTVITTDPIFGTCLEIVKTGNAEYLYTRAVVPIGQGRVYRLSVVYRATVLPTDNEFVVTAVVQGLTSAYASVASGGILGTTNITNNAANLGTVQTATMIFSGTPLANTQQLAAGSTLIRVGLWKQGVADTGSPTIRIQGVFLEDITDAYKANAAAAAAQAVADTAASGAGTANSLLADIASDAKFTAVEKQQTKTEVDSLVGERLGIEARATAYGISTLLYAYGTACNTLFAYTDGLLANLTTTSDIVSATFRSNFSSLYIARQALLNEIARVAGTKATWDGVSAIPYEYIMNNDDTTALGLNASFEDWTGAFPAGWADIATGGTPTKETTIVRSGTTAVKWVAAAQNNLGMYQDVSFGSAGLPAGTFMAGAIDIYMTGRVSGKPVAFIQFYTSAAMSAAAMITPTQIVPPSTDQGVWQRVPWSARAGPTDIIYGLRVVISGSNIYSGGGVYTGTAIFDNFRLALFDSTTDNKAIVLVDAGSGTLTNQNGAAVAVNVLMGSNPITPSNVGTFITSAAIGTAYIGNLAVTSAKIADANITTLKIGANQVTVPQSVTYSNGTGLVLNTSYTNIGTALSILIPGTETGIVVLISWSVESPGQTSGPATRRFRLQQTVPAAVTLYESHTNARATGDYSAGAIKATINQGTTYTFQLQGLSDNSATRVYQSTLWAVAVQR